MTAQVARAAFPNGCLTIRIRDALGPVFEDQQFTALFATRGRPAVSPARLALVSVLQFVEGLSDRQAADAVGGRIDWKYALGLELADTGFDASVLSEFRARLVAGDAAQQLLDRMLERLKAQGLLVRGGRQRTDATCVAAAVRDLNRLELVVETLRAALEALAATVPAWLAALAPADWYQRYGQRASDYRLPQPEAARTALAVTVGADGLALLEAVYAADAPGWLRQVPAVQTLRATWVQQYYRDQQGLRWRGKAELGLAPAGVAITSPYDADARYGIKRGVGWVGYKAHVTETCEPDRPHLIVHVATTTATTADVDTVPARHADLARADLLPDQHLVDAGYVSVDHLLAARVDHGVELVGPLPPDSGWQARDKDGFDLTRFHIDWDRKQVTCPTGTTSRNWQEASSRHGLPIIHVAFPTGDCARCPVRARCTRSPTSARGLTFRPRAQYQTQQQLRAEQATTAWRDRYAHRSGSRAPSRSIPPRRPPPGPLPRPAQDPPAAPADRAGPQPGPRRRLAHRHAAGRQLGLPPHQAPTSPITRVNSPAESLWGEVHIAAQLRTHRPRPGVMIARHAHPRSPARARPVVAAKWLL